MEGISVRAGCMSGDFKIPFCSGHGSCPEHFVQVVCCWSPIGFTPVRGGCARPWRYRPWASRCGSFAAAHQPAPLFHAPYVPGHPPIYREHPASRARRATPLFHAQGVCGPRPSSTNTPPRKFTADRGLRHSPVTARPPAAPGLAPTTTRSPPRSRGGLSAGRAGVTTGGAGLGYRPKPGVAPILGQPRR